MFNVHCFRSDYDVCVLDFYRGNIFLKTKSKKHNKRQ